MLAPESWWADLAAEHELMVASQPLRKALWKTGQQEVIFTDSTADSEVKRLLQAAIREYTTSP